MIASLGMYDRAETAISNDVFWECIRKNLGYGPENLDRVSEVMQVWQSPDLLFSQTCGLPFRTILHDKVQLVGTPDYGFSGIAPGFYYSVFVVRKEASDVVEDFRDRVFACNEIGSQSGWAAPQNHAQTLGFGFENVTLTGGHLASAGAVANGLADIAAIDAQTWRMICKYRDYTGALKVIAKTQPTPGLPYITSLTQDAGAIFGVVKATIQNLNEETRRVLGITGIVSIDKSEYLRVPNPKAPLRIA
ncbi:MAG: PhnD/SsuA/transferrin family substrate-binding protein [Paracoccaceae bacterium]